MSGQIKVDFSSLAELQSQVGSSAQKILTEIEEIKRTVDGTQSYWTGAAQDQFGARYGQLETAQKNVQDAISQFGGLVGRANSAYSEAESKIKGMFA
ncbi:MAG: WXG100 family type VII secretion target [Mycobacteriales bacterium]